MGNAVMSSVFPDIFLEYSIFCMPLWVLIYLWGVPTLLIAGENKKDGERTSFKERIEPLLNPMFAAMIIGIVFGLSGFSAVLPESVCNVIKVSGDCMSPIAMLLTGMTIAESDLLKMLTKWQTYLLSIIRLLVIPSVFILIFAFVPKSEIINDTFLICGLASLAMPLGLNTIVVPKGYGKDTTDAAGMALISHTMSIGTIPLMFLLLTSFVL
jgi:predicted permease